MEEKRQKQPEPPAPAPRYASKSVVAMEERCFQLDEMRAFFPLNLVFILSWNIVDLQYCVSFRCTAKCSSYTHTHTHTHIHSFSDSFPI